MNSLKENFKYYKEDLSSGLVVFLVALPLCLGIALASGAPLLSGLVTGIVGGTVVALVSKSHTSVSGPAAGLTVIVLNALTTMGTFELLLTAVVLGGIFQIALAYMKAGLIADFFPSSVIRGMLAAIGLILILKQIPHFLGVDADAFGEMEFIQEDGSNTFSYLFYALNHVYIGAFLVGALSLLLLILWENKGFKATWLGKTVPGALAVVITGVLMNELYNWFYPAFAIEASHLVSLPSITSVESLQQSLNFPDFSGLLNTQVYVTGITIAIVASLETLLCIEAVDKLDPMKRSTPKNDELKAQGIGNIIAGLLGGLPMTAVIVRGSANVGSGAKTKMSAFYHGILLLLAIFVFPGILNKIPLASLAAILIVIGFKLSKPSLYKYHYKLGKEHFVPFVVTIAAILFTDLLIGIGIGFFIGTIFILKSNYKHAYHYENGSDTIRIKLSEHVSFLNKISILHKLNHIPENSQVIIDGSLTEDIHHDVLEIIEDFKNKAEERAIKLEILNVPGLSKYISQN